MNSRKNALIGQASENDLRIALDFEQAARALYKSQLYQDHIVMPGLFLVRQFLELGLKYNIRKLDTISTSKSLISQLNHTHDLLKLHQSFEEHYQSAKKSKKNDQLEQNEQNLLDNLKELVKKVSALDNGSQGFRYAEDKSGIKMIDHGESLNLEEIFELLNDASLLLTHTEDVFNLASQS